MTSYNVEPTCQVQGLPALLQGVFGYKTHGFFVEIGAYDGKTYSNTYHLAKIGWHGVYVEPVADAYAKCLQAHQNHPGVLVLNCAISSHTGHLALYTNDSDTFAAFGDVATELSVSRLYDHVRCLTLNDLFASQNLSVYDVDLLVIDVEGHERAVLESFFIGFYAPKMVIVEAHELHENRNMAVNAAWLNTFFSRYGYIRIYCDSINNIYIRTGV